MKRKSKRILSVLLAVVTVLATLPLTALNTFAETSGDFDYYILSETDKTCEFASYRGSAATFDIPSVLDGYTVVSIGEYSFQRHAELTSVTIPDSVTSIGSYAFFNCTALTSVTIPDSVTRIWDYAFSGCSSLTSITIPDGVTKMISSLSFYDTAYYNDVSNWENDVLYIGNHFIKAKETLSGAYAIKAGTKTIADSAFANCTSLASVTIPDSVTSIEKYTFFNCPSLTSVTIPDSVTSIGYYTFSGCTSLASITIPDSVTEIGANAFSNTAYYNNASNWENDVLYIGKHLIKANETLSGAYAIKLETKTIADHAFQDCTSLTSVTIPDSVTGFGAYVFCGCTALASVTIPNSVIGFGAYVFCGCTALASVTIPNSVTIINEDAFSGCTSLTSVTIPNSVTIINEDAFSGCTSLTSVTIPDSVTFIDDMAFGYYYQDGEIRKVDEFTIYGYAGTAAETYASANGFAFVNLRNLSADVSGDNKVNAVDARWVLQAASGARTLTEAQKLAADVSGDGKVNAIDARWILQIASGARSL